MTHTNLYNQSFPLFFRETLALTILLLYFCNSKQKLQEAMHKEKLFPLFFFILLFAASNISCKDNKKKEELQSTLEKLYGRKVRLSTDSMMMLSPNKSMPCGQTNNPLLSVVSFVDTLSCSPCILNDLYNWRDFIDSLNTYNGRICVYFIFDAPQAMLHETVYEAQFVAREIGIPLYLDTLHIFTRTNQLRLPANTHVFVLDQNMRVCLVGNLIYNSKLEELFWKEANKIKRRD